MRGIVSPQPAVQPPPLLRRRATLRAPLRAGAEVVATHTPPPLPRASGTMVAVRIIALVLAITIVGSGCHSVLFPPDQDPQCNVMRGPGVPHARALRYYWGFANHSDIEVRGVGMKADNGEVASGGANMRPAPLAESTEGP